MRTLCFAQWIGYVTILKKRMFEPSSGSHAIESNIYCSQKARQIKYLEKYLC
jgi:hypothetical protein